MTVAPLSTLLPPGALAALPPAGTPPSAEAVSRASAQFEAILIRQLMAPAIEPMMSGSLGGGAGAGVYGYLLTDVLATSLSQGGGLGLAKMLESQLAPASAAGEPPEEVSS